MIKLDLMEKNEAGELIIFDTTILKPSTQTASQWIESSSRGYDKENVDIGMTSQFVVSSDDGGYKPEGVLFFMVNKGNSIGMATQNCYLLNARCEDSQTKCIPIFPENFGRAMVVLTARTTIPHNWSRDRDEFSTPSKEILESEEFAEYSFDSLVFNAFSNFNHLNSFNYKGTDYNNQMFFMTKQEVLDFFNETNNHTGYTKIQHEEDRFMAKAIQLAMDSGKISEEAKKVVLLSKELYKLSYKYRELYTPKSNQGDLMQTERWDLGWKQLRLIIEEFKSDDKELLKTSSEFYSARKTLQEKLAINTDKLDFYGRRELFLADQ